MRDKASTKLPTVKGIFNTNDIWDSLYNAMVGLENTKEKIKDTLNKQNKEIYNRTLKEDVAAAKCRFAITEPMTALNDAKNTVVNNLGVLSLVVNNPRSARNIDALIVKIHNEYDETFKDLLPAIETAMKKRDELKEQYAKIVPEWWKDLHDFYEAIQQLKSPDALLAKIEENEEKTKKLNDAAMKCVDDSLKLENELIHLHEKLISETNRFEAISQAMVPLEQKLGPSIG
jgi:chromosome segregation ATPase